LLPRNEAAEVKSVVHWMSEILLATKITLGGLHRCMPQQELNLLKLAATAVAQLRTGSPQIVGSNVLQARSLATGPHYIPHHVLRDALAPCFVRSGDRPKDSSLGYPGGHGPLVERGFDPFRNGNRANVAALANEIDHCPVPLADLDLLHLQTD
jgi:hypothetical protein